MIIDHHVIHVHKHTFSLNIEFDTAKKKNNNRKQQQQPHATAYVFHHRCVRRIDRSLWH